MATVPRRRVSRPPSTGRRMLRWTVILVVLAATFGGGLLTGRHLERKAARVVHDPDAPGDATRSRGRSAASESALPRIQEKLTFYQTLTAPLNSGADDGRQRQPARAADPKPHVKPGPKPVVTAAPTASPLASAPATDARAETPGGYTIQVAAYRSRAQADALLAKLGADAYVTEGVVDSAIAFRVRVGTFGSRAEAEAARLERSLGGFITPR